MYQQLHTKHDIDSLPRTIWIPKLSTIPACYSGTPLDMLSELAQDMGRDVRIDDAIQYLLQDIEEEQGVSIKIPSAEDSPPHIRAAMVVLLSLVTGYAREVPRA